MNANPSQRRPLSALACLVALSGLTFALASGCGQSEAATQRGASSEAAAAPQAAPGKGPKIDAETYSVEMKVKGPVAAGKEGTLEIELLPKGAYHINNQYPYKFKLAEPAPEGVTFPKPLLKREDGKFEEKKGSFKVPFVASKAGKVKVAGTLSMSVCSDANCLMEKVDLEVDVDVK
ncbi:hypothetical protein [Polyangium aurulentum]|uniref:hypothetical protein n=1 Tax=Polyangium aurulentum TaxID=2567896 RepID=UPI0010AE06F5|nr:hypothetical protein [Polyangium aurulentum]UQA56140.1 hypothetical protein E8A73_033185 [Polyangium aurulentum]